MFEFIVTDDGSPTVRISSPGASADQMSSEAMHSLKGAFSETVYIYGAAIELCFSSGYTPRVLSLGLGIGYVEILAAGLAVKHDKTSTFSGESFELLPELRDYFCTWLKNGVELPATFAESYDQILTRTAAHLGVDAGAVRQLLCRLVESGRWQIRDALTAATHFAERYGCICFDAFSSKSTPDLWKEEFLINFFNQTCAPQAVLSTYACTGQLKRALRSSGFTVQIRTGFSGKRDSTFAVRS
jgi:hypothetical protein